MGAGERLNCDLKSARDAPYNHGQAPGDRTSVMSYYQCAQCKQRWGFRYSESPVIRVGKEIFVCRCGKSWPTGYVEWAHLNAQQRRDYFISTAEIGVLVICTFIPALFGYAIGERGWRSALVAAGGGLAVGLVFVLILWTIKLGIVGLSLRRRPQPAGNANPTVPFLDPSERVIQIPPSELQPGMLHVQIQGQGRVWARADQIQESTAVPHPPFDDHDRAYIRQIQAAFAEHRPLSFEEWEEGFRCDAHPQQEIAIWLFAAEVYKAFTDNEPSSQKRRDVYRVILTCLTTSPDTFWDVLKLEALSRAEAEQVAKRVYGKHYREKWSMGAEA